MTTPEQPLVSVVTPVYNGEAFLAECIESVLAQTYSNWEYIVVDNHSTDGTSRIAHHYAGRDGRIHVYHNDELLPIIANHNHALGLMSPDSKYCKIVSADDWLYPECLSRMVQLAERSPSVGIVGSYQVSGGGDEWYVRGTGLPVSCTVLSGREICRLHLLAGLYVFGAPTANLYRCDLIRNSDAFFPNPTAEADVSACIKHLRNSDFGFIHQVLSYERFHSDRITTNSRSLDAYTLSKISDLLTYGPDFVTGLELEKRLKELLNKHYQFLGIAAVNFRERAYWQFQKKRLAELGCPLDRVKLAKAVCAKLLDLLLSPKETLGKFQKRRNRVAELSPGMKESNT
jgi:glycosyltransferase involved in cell wall biosynthesis